MFKLTLDTSCLLAIDDPATGPDIIRLINLALGGAATIALTSTVAAELPTAPVTTIGKVAVTRLEMFPVLGLSGDERLRRDALRDQLLTSLFPNATGGSATWRHDRLDCEHLAAHLLRGRDLFVTLDKPLLRKASTAREAGIELLAPDAARMRIEEAGWTPPQQPEDLVIRLQRPADDAAVTASFRNSRATIPIFAPGCFGN